MPYLNWKEMSLTHQEVIKRGSAEPGGAEDQMRMRIGLTPAGRGELLTRLQEVLVVPEIQEAGAPSSFRPTLTTELRLDLPLNWIIFWKLRDGESRLLLAHPHPSEWVATAALSLAHAHAFLARLESLEMDSSLILSDLGLVDSVSNTEIVLTLAPGS